MSAQTTTGWYLDIEPPEWMTVPRAPADVAGWRADAAAVFEVIADVERQLVEAEELPPSMMGWTAGVFIDAVRFLDGRAPYWLPVVG